MTLTDSQASRPLSIDDLGSLAVPSQPAISPDGTRVAYVVRTVDLDEDRHVDRLWVVPTAGEGEPRRLTAGPSDVAPAWSPDGTRLAFLRDGQVHVLPVDGGEAEKLTDLALGAGVPVWSPDSSRLVFSAPVDPGYGGKTKHHQDVPMVSDGVDYQADGAGLIGALREQVFVLDLASRDVRRITDGRDSASGPAWSPDGTSVAFTRRVGEDSDLRYRTAVHVLAVGADLDVPAEPRVVGFTEGVAATVTWSEPDSLLVTGWSGDPTGHIRLYRLALADGDVVELSASLDRNVMPGALAYPGGRPVEYDGRVLFCLRDRGSTHLWSVRPDGTDARAVVAGDGRVVSGLSVASGQAAIVLGTPTSYGELVAVDLGSGEEKVLTEHGASLEGIRLFERAERTFVISDGTEVHGWLIRDPERSGRLPLLLDVHGGPHNAWNAAADEMHLYHQELVSRGWAVLVLNPRGSDGYGEKFYDGVRGAWGTADAADFLEPLDALVAEGIADPERLALTGYSYGGFMTCWLTAHTDRFAAAVAGGIVSDLSSMGGTSDDSSFLSAYELDGFPWQTPENYAAMSPITRVDQVRTPTLVLHGGADVRCPIGQAQQWHTALREQGVPTRLVVYPGGSHAFILAGRPSHRLDYNRRVVEWVEQYAVREGRPPLDTAHWRRRLDWLARKHRVPGAQLGILRVGGVTDGSQDELSVSTYGVLSARTGLEVSDDAVFQIGSISKVWTATVVMRLVDEGLLSLDAPVVDVLPELRLADPDTTARVTIRHLLTHTSGIDGDVFTDTGRGDDNLEKYVAVLGEAGQNHPLGVTWSYCNSGFSLLGRIIEKVTGQVWDQAMRERLYEPLGLEHTVTLPEEAIVHAAAIGHELHEGELIQTPAFMLPRPLGPAGLITARVADVLEFARLHLTGGLAKDGTRLLAEDTAAAMVAHETDLPDAYSLGDSWGLGFIRFGWDGRRVYGHDGNTLGQAAFLRILPDPERPGQGLAVSLLTNGGHTRDLYEDLYREIFAEVAGITMPVQLAPPEVPYDGPGADASPYVGTYERASTRIEIEQTENEPLLRTTITGPLAALVEDPTDELPMTPVGPGLFVARPEGAETWMPITFYELPTGEPYVHLGVRATPKVSDEVSGKVSTDHSLRSLLDHQVGS